MMVVSDPVAVLLLAFSLLAYRADKAWTRRQQERERLRANAGLDLREVRRRRIA